MDFKKIELPGLEFVDSNTDYSTTQTIFIDFDGINGVSYDNDALNIYINNINVEHSGLSQDEQFQIITDLNNSFAGTAVSFTVTAPANEEYSTIYVGGDGSSFSEYGSFLGIAETIDGGNQINNDEAFVFSGNIDSISTITETIVHEAAHILGFAHTGDISTDELGDFASVPVEDSTKFIASDGAANDNFGFSVSVSGDTFVAGAYCNDYNYNNSGSVYVYRWNGSSYDEIKLNASDIARDDFFGIAVSSSGDNVLVGACGDDDNATNSGSAYVYRWNGTSYDETKLTASDGAASDYFGYSASISGDNVLVGAFRDDDNGTDSGSAYVYRWDGAEYDEYKLTASDGAANDDFGGPGSVSISGDTVVAGAQYHDDNYTDSGSAYVYRWNGTSYDETKLTASDSAADDRFGYSVAISGDTIVVGAYCDDDKAEMSGGVYVYHWDGAAYTEYKLTASDGGIGDGLGCSVSVSGDYVLAGATWDGDDGTNSGSAYLYHWNGSSYDEIKKLTAYDAAKDDYFAYSVSISEDTVVIGARFDDDNGDNSGSAYSFALADLTSSQSPDDSAGLSAVVDQLNQNVSLDWTNPSAASKYHIQVDNNGDFSSPEFDSESIDSEIDFTSLNDGAHNWRVRAYAGGGYGDWVQGDSFTVAKSDGGTKLTASDGAIDDYFACSVSVSGDNLVVGALLDDGDVANSGSAYVYRWDGTEYDEYKLTASDSAAHDYFGASVSISGDNVLVGAYYDDDMGSYSGSAYVYRWDGTAYNEYKLTASDGALGDSLGYAVAISGDTVVAGAYGDEDYGYNSGSMYVYRWDGTAYTDEYKLIASDGAAVDNFACSVSISGDNIVAGAHNDDSYSGSAYVYRWNGTSYSETKLIASDRVASAFFGGSVSISGDNVVVGAHADNANGTNSGSAYVYRWDGAEYDEYKLTASDIAVGDYFGGSVSISGDYVLVGAYRDDDNGTDSGSVYLYHWNGSSYDEKNKIIASDGVASDHFGYSVSISEDTVVVGARLDDDNGSNSGSAYTFALAELVDLVAPSVPDGTTDAVTVNNVALGWNDSTDNAGGEGFKEYVVEYADNSEFTAATSQTVGVSELSINSLTDGSYYWRVKALDNNDNNSAWSTVDSFDVDTSAPDVPSNLSFVVSGDDVALDWADSSDNLSGLDEYVVEYADNSGFTDATSQTVIISGLDISNLAEGTYYWRVKAFDNNDNNSVWSTVDSFDVDTSAPDVPSSLSFVVSSDDVALDWADSSDNLSGLDEYVVEYADNSGFTDATSQTVSISELDISNLAEDTYYWRVKAVDELDNESNWSETEEFTICTPRCDFDGNGKSDILWYNQIDGTVGVWGGGDVHDWRVLGNLSPADWEIVGIGDFNANNTSDVLWQNKIDGTVGIWESGTEWEQKAAVSRTAWEIVGVGDFNGNNTSDVLWRNKIDGTVGIWESGTDWQQRAAVSLTVWEVVGVGDFNGNSTSDVLWQNKIDGTVGIWESGTNWEQRAAVSLTVWEIVGVGDFNGNSTSDVLWQSKIDGTVGIWESGTNWEQRAAVSRTDWEVVGAGDFNGNNTSDVLWQNKIDYSVGMWESGTDWQALGDVSSDWKICIA